ncbi:hypothetical protein JXD20_01355 [Candidatus Peregrinibacteria bacterium]|nr:hypothetical protein [Candidatus Peregrinibacteria bacterium]
MDVRDIVRKAWQITQVHLKKLIWYGFTPAFFGVIVSSVYLAYQYNAFKHSVLFESGLDTDVIGTAKTVWSLASLHPAVSITLIAIGIIVLLGYVLTPPVFRGTLIHALMQIRRYESIEGSVEVGVRHFFPMFEFALLTGAFSITTLFTESSFILRWWGENIFFIALPILLFIAMAGLIISFLFTYAEYYIILWDHTLIKSIMESSILVISNLKKTILVFVLMLLIGVRVILNVLLILLIPMLVVVLSSYFATIFLSTLGIIFIGLAGFAVLIVSSYLMGLFHIFATGVWVLTFAALTERDEKPKEVPSEAKEE